MPAPLLPKDEVVARIARTFREQGYSGTSLAELAEQTGLGKASLYHYFPDGKKGMAIAALDAFGDALTRKVIDPLSGEGAPRARIAAMFDGFDEVYGQGSDLCLFALLSVGDARELFAPNIAPMVGKLANALAATLAETGLKTKEAAGTAEEIMVQLEGALIMARVLADPGIFQRALARLRTRFA